MLYLTCTIITSIDLAHYGVSRAKDWVSVKCGTKRRNDSGLAESELEQSDELKVNLRMCSSKVKTSKSPS